MPHRLAALQGLAMVRLFQGKYKSALAHAEQARTMAASGDALTHSMILWLYANIAREMSLAEEASEAYRESYRLLKSIPAPFKEVGLLLDWLLLCVKNELHSDASRVADALAPYSQQMKQWKALRARIEDVVCAMRLDRLSTTVLRTARAAHEKVSRSQRWWPAPTLLQIG
ncbi:MAG: tetratricopeptide repeat protein [Acidobacteria bacterium]|nr:MAG: tetratricopeptide repeat protein [Acidobacteriota bacterium]